MYRKIVVPTERDHTVELPPEFYGQQVEVLAFTLPDELPETFREVDVKAFYDTIRLDFSGFKFDRDEANER